MTWHLCKLYVSSALSQPGFERDWHLSLSLRAVSLWSSLWAVSGRADFSLQGLVCWSGWKRQRDALHAPAHFLLLVFIARTEFLCPPGKRRINNQTHTNTHTHRGWKQNQSESFVKNVNISQIIAFSSCQNRCVYLCYQVCKWWINTLAIKKYYLGRNI